MRRALFAFLGFIVASSSLSGQPLGRIKALDLGDTDADLVFTPLPPCRIIDTRPTSAGLLAGGTTRDFKVAGTNAFDLQGGTVGGCGVPIGATSVLINFVAVNPLGGGNLRGSAWPDPVPTIGSILNYQFVNPNLNIANGIAFPICDPSAGDCDFDIRLFANGAGTHVVADVLGFFKRFPKEQIVSAITAGPGLLTTAATGNITLSANFAGTGAANTVARGDHKHYFRTVLVSPIEGGTAAENGAALVAALNGITTAAFDNPFLLKIEPGIYETGGTAVRMKQYVDIEGSGESVTIIRGVGTNNANDGVVEGINNAELRFLSVECAGTSTHCTGIYNAGDSPKISYVTARASGGTIENIAIYNDLSSHPEMFHVTGIGNGGVLGEAYGIVNRSSNPSMRSVTGKCTGANRCWAIGNFAGSPTMIDVVAKAENGISESVAFRNVAGSNPYVNGLIAEASGGTLAIGIAVLFNSTPRLQNFFAFGAGQTTSYGMHFSSASGTFASGTMLNGEITATGATTTNTAIQLESVVTTTFTNVRAISSGIASRALVTTASHAGTVKITRSTLEGGVGSVSSNGTGIFRIGESDLSHTVLNLGAGGSFGCLFSHNASTFNAMGAACN